MNDLFWSLPKSCVNDFETGIAECAGNHFGSAIVAIETRFGDKHSNSFRHQIMDSSYTPYTARRASQISPSVA